MRKVTRVDVFTNIDEYIKFLEWARTKEPKTRADMVRLLAEYRSPNFVVNAHPERVEHEITKNFRVAKTLKPKEKRNETSN